MPFALCICNLKNLGTASDVVGGKLSLPQLRYDGGCEKVQLHLSVRAETIHRLESSQHASD